MPQVSNLKRLVRIQHPALSTHGKYTMTIMIGDVHGKYNRYKSIIKQHKDTIAIGDMGIGFRDRRGDRFLINPPYDRMVENNARFIRGNHDNPSVCKNHTQYIADGTIEGNVMFIGGAGSIDREHRTENIDWWADEECSTQELSDIVDLAIEKKPEIIVSHDCPQEVVRPLFLGYDLHKSLYPTRTGQALESIRQLVKPKLWIFGHWHIDRDAIIDGTRYICLAELACRDINFDTMEVSGIL